MKKFTDQKGITLVALVITIIVLLILAGISLQLVLGENGILHRASSSSEMQKAATAREECELDVADKAAELIYNKYVNNSEQGSTSVASHLKSATTAALEDATNDVDGIKLKSGAYYTVEDGTGADAGKIVVTLYVPNANGSTEMHYIGYIDEQGKWTTPIDIKDGHEPTT